MPVKEPKGIVVHPIVLLSAVDHFNRMSKIGNQKQWVCYSLPTKPHVLTNKFNTFSYYYDQVQNIAS